MISQIRLHKINREVTQIETQACSYRGEWQSYVTMIHHRNDKEKYNLLASFLIDVENCRNNPEFDDCAIIPLKVNVDISLKTTKRE